MYCKKDFNKFFAICLFLGAVCFISGETGFMSRRLGDFIGLSLLGFFILTYMPGGYISSDASGGEDDSSNKTRLLTSVSRFVLRQRINLSLILVFIAYGLLLPQLDGIIKVLSLAVFLLLVDAILRKQDASRKEIPALVLTVLFYAVFLLLYQYVPQTWFVLQKISLACSQFIGTIIQSQMSLGVTLAGLKISVLFALYFLSLFTLSVRRSVYVLTTGMLLIAVCNAIYIVLWGFINNSSVFAKIQLAQPLLTGFDFRLLLFLLLLPPAFYYTRLTPPPDPGPYTFTRGSTKKAFPIVALLFLAVMFSALQLPGPKTSREVLFYDSYLNFELPTFGKYGLENVGMFGLIPDYLAARGYTVRRSSVLTPENLANAGVLVIVNLYKSFDRDTTQAIWDYVNKGGSLLILGDHTGDEQIRKPFNNLLQPYNISFNFDSAIPLQNRWVHSFELRPHPITRGIGEGEVQINIGASLTALPPARPVILGGYGFSDTGDLREHARGFLGDMKYNPGEQLGDLVLSAEAHQGKGKVLVFGDTTFLQNGSITHSYRFIDNIFDWLTTGQKTKLYPENKGFVGANLFAQNAANSIVVRLKSNLQFYLLSWCCVSGMCVYLYNTYLALLFTGAFLVVFILRASKDTTLPAVCSLAMLLFLILFQAAVPDKPDQGQLNANVTLIDASHSGRYSVDPMSPNCIDGLIANLIRNGRIPLMMRDFSQETLASGRLLVLIAPAEKFSPAELDSLKKYISGGGVLLLAAGWEESGAAAPLLKEFDLGIGNKPLGQAVSSLGGQPFNLWDAWPLVAAKGDKIEILAESYNEPVVIFKPYGRGGLAVIGDSHVFLNKNLESVYQYNENNILFFKEMLQKIQQRLASA